MRTKKQVTGKGQQKTTAELEAEIAALRAFNRTEGIVQLLNNLIKYGSFVTIAYFAKEALVAMAGRTTLADIGIEILGSMELSVAAPTLSAIVTAMWALGERRLRKDTIQRQSDHIRYLETKIDPSRSSSSLTMRGDTPREVRS